MSESGKTRARFLAFVAHEIKNPLATALWSADLLKRIEPGERGAERAEKMIDVSLRALRRMRRLVDDYFTLERLLENGYDLKREQVPLGDLVRAAVQATQEKDGISTEGWSVEVEGGTVTCDGDMLRRAFRALFEHMARGAQAPKLQLSVKGGELHIRSEAPPSPLVPPEPEDRPSGDPTGAVLGFTLAARIIQSHGGKIEERDGGLLVSLPVV
jgi:signal transduction histidine kinase